MQIHEVKRPGPSHDRSETTPNTFLRVYIVYIVNGAIEHAESAPQGDEDAADTRMPRSLPHVYTSVRCKVFFLERLAGICVRSDAIVPFRIRKTKR